jgi:hypothetical protein
MKKSVLVGMMALGFAIPAFANAKVSFNDFLKVANEELERQPEGSDDCIFHVRENDGSVVLTMNDGKEEVTLIVARGDEITLIDKSSGDDDLVEYKVANKGSLSVEIADDAFIIDTLTYKGHKASCEVDM